MKRKKILSQRHKDTKKKRKGASKVFFSLCLCVFVRGLLLFFSFPRSGVGMPSGRSGGASPDVTLERRDLLPRWSVGAR